MKPHYQDDAVTVYHGDCLDVLAELPDASVDSVVTDPPYGLDFMGKHWDTGAVAFDTAVWGHCLRVLKPGGHLLAFGGCRTWHRLAVAIEDAGFEIRENLAWLTGQGFPKSLNVTDALGRIVPDDARCVCAQRSTQTVPSSQDGCPSDRDSGGGQLPLAADSGQSLTPLPVDAPAHNRDGQPADVLVSAPASNGPGEETVLRSTWDFSRQSERPLAGGRSDASAQFGKEGNTSTALVEGHRKTQSRTPDTSGLAAGSASNSPLRNKYMACPDCGGVVIPAGLGTALKPAFEPIVCARKPLAGTVAANVLAHGVGALNIDGCRINPGAPVPGGGGFKGGATSRHEGWTRPSHENGAAVEAHTAGRWPSNVVIDGHAAAEIDRQSGITRSTSTQGVQRHGRSAGIMGNVGELRDGRPEGHDDEGGASRFFPTFRYQAKAATDERPSVNGISHPTVKPLDLMRWLVRLVTPPGGTVLEPFAGSGTTAEACIHEHMKCIAIEREVDYLPLIVARLSKPMEVGFDFGSAS